MQKPCNFENHDDGISFFCTNFLCKYKGPACAKCLQEFHIQHPQDLKGVDEFNNWRQGLQKTYKKLSQFLDDITIFINFMNDFITSLKTPENEKLENNQLKELTSLTQKLIQLNLLEKSGLIENTLKKVCENLKNTKADIKNFQAAKSLEEIISNNKQVLKEVNSQMNLNNLQVEQQIKLKQEVNAYTIRFSLQYKSDNIVLENENTIATDIEGKFSLVVCEPGILDSQEQQQFAFKILKDDWLAIGICHQLQISKQKKEINLWDNNNHGCYLIDKYGKVFSQLNKNENNCLKNFDLKVNDIVIVKVDKSLKKVQWINQRSNEQLWITSIDILQDIYPIVCLYKSSIQIVDEL